MATKDRTALKDEFKNGNLATGERFTDLIDSMKVVQEPVADPAASGTSLTFIDSISQDADGKITPTKKTLDLANAHELNPFKGWYETGDTLPTDGFDGAYLYFKDTSELTGQTTIYRWNGTAYTDTGTVVDTSNVQTFETGQALNGVAIDGTDLKNPAPNALAKAEDVAPIKSGLGDIPAVETKVTVDVENNVLQGFIRVTNGSASKPNGCIQYGADASNRYAIIPIPNGAKSIRFSGLLSGGDAAPTAGYAFYNCNSADDLKVAQSSGSLLNVSGNVVGSLGLYPYDGTGVNKLSDIVAEVPQGAKYLCTMYSYSDVLVGSNFYCYVNMGGATVMDMITELSADVYNTSVGQIQLSDILRYDSTNYVRGYIDENIVSLKIDIAQNSVITCDVVKEKTGTNNGNVVIASGKNILVKWKRDEVFTHLVLRFSTTDSSAISVAGVLSAIEDSNITYEHLQKQDEKNDVIEMPITGLVQSQDATKIVADSIYTPEQFNFGGFEVVLPTYMGVDWYRGDNPDTFTRHSSYYNGDTVVFHTKYSYNNIFRLQFFIIGSSRTILVSDIEDAIENGRLKILYRPNDGHLSITQRQTHCEPYLRALQARLVTDYSATQRKSYGTHDLPMFVHCTDVHNDIVRLSSAFEYARYIQADALILTGDYCMRGATNGYGYIKELDDKWNPEGQNATQRIPYLVGTGNHDPWKTNLADMRSHLIDPFIEKHNYKLDANNLISDVAYYYVDMDVPAPRNGGYEYNEPLINNTQKVRIIMLDLVDEQAGEISRWGISQTQIEWFIDTLNSTPQGAAILIGLHTLPDEGVAPSDKAAGYATEDPRTRELRYVSDMFTYKGYLPYNEEMLNGSYDFSGSPIVEIIDAYISKGQASGTYSYKVGGTSHSIPQQAAVTKTVNWSCDFSNAGGVFVAYLCGHTHADFVTYIDNSTNTQLCLCSTCTVCEYGPYRNGRGSSNADCIRGSSGSTQDGFNVYVLDMENKRVGIARIGSNMTVNLEPRTACWISFADSPIQ